MATVTGMATRRPLNELELQAAAAIESALEAHPESRETVAERLGITPSGLNHWAGPSALLAVPLDRVGHLASILGVDPADISVRWRENVAPYISSQSQPKRLDGGIIRNAIELVAQTFDASGVDFVIGEDLEEIAQAVNYILANGISRIVPQNVLDFMKYLRAREDERAGRNESAGRHAGVEGTGKAGKKASPRRKAG